MAAIFCYEILEALRILREPDFYLPQEDPDLENGKMWVGPADDIILRKRGVEFVDGSAPGFAAIVVGACPDPETAKMIVEDYQKKNLYIFCAAHHNGTSVIEQFIEAGVQIGWGTRIVPFGPDISSAVFPSVLPIARPWRLVGFNREIIRRSCIITKTGFLRL